MNEVSPVALVDGERLLWQGRPTWRGLAIHAYHARKVGLYFGVIIAAQAAVRLVTGASMAEAFHAALWLMPLGAAAVSLLVLLAWGSARSTRYVLTSKRIVMRIGIALPITLTIPFAQVDGAALAQHGDGAGDLCFRVGKSNRVAYLLLWPHARPFHIRRPEPAFRAIADLDRVADLAAQALSAPPQPKPEIVTRAAALLAAAE
jgi:Bacterial PH domain